MTLCPLPPLRLARLLFELRPSGPLRLEVSDRGNVLRSNFGRVFRRMVCRTNGNDCRLCPDRASCPYARIFDPSLPTRHGRQTTAERPFFFRPPLSHDPEFGPQRPLQFELRLFGSAIAESGHFVNAFSQLVRTGMAGTRVELVSVRSLGWRGEALSELVRDGCSTGSSALPLDFDYLQSQSAEAATTATFHFFTPTCVHYGGKEQRVPSLEGLACRVLTRAAALCEMYGEGGLEENLEAAQAAVAKAARPAVIAAWDGGWKETARASAHTGRTMPLHGFQGTVTIENIAHELWPLLWLGQEIHVGQQTVWGNGWYRVEATGKTASQAIESRFPATVTS